MFFAYLFLVVGKDVAGGSGFCAAASAADTSSKLGILDVLLVCLPSG